MSIILQAEKLYKEYKTSSGAVNALNGVDLSIEKGLFYAIIGRSGSGKSTLLHVLSGLDRPTSGKVLIGGVDMFSFSDEKMAIFRRRSMGFVFQQFRLLSGMTALENVALPLALQGVPRHERSERALAVLERVGLSDRANHRPHQLSGGQQQRVAIARAVVTEPCVILADEPTAGLDPAAADSVMELFDRLHRSGHTLVLITHDEWAAQCAARRMHLENGCLFE